jgi:hypothetical protein
MTALKIHPAAELFPMLGDAELQDLGADIRKRGLLFPISIYGKTGELLDGRNRLAACEIAEVEPSRYCYPGDDPVGFVLAANVHRRHLTAEQKRDLIAKVLKLDPKKSDRQIAKAVKVDNKTVAKVRREEEGREEIPHVEKRTDSKGRAQPASKPKPATVPAPNFVQQVTPIDEHAAKMAALDHPPAAEPIDKPKRMTRAEKHAAMRQVVDARRAAEPDEKKSAHALRELLFAVNYWGLQLNAKHREQAIERIKAALAIGDAS